MAGERIAFTGPVNDPVTSAFDSDLDGSFMRIADGQTLVPGGGGSFFGCIHQIGNSEDLIAFIGFDESFNQAGLFGFANSSLFRIAGPGDIKKENPEDEGKTVSSVDFQPDAIDGNVLAYTAYFTDGSSAAYLVAVALPVPEPAAWLLLAVGLAVVLGCARQSIRHG